MGNGYNMEMLKVRLDVLLVENGLAESRAKAQGLIMAGQVRVNGQVADRVAANIPPDAEIRVDQGPRFVSRGGDKLEAALTTFPINVSGLVCADVGASTGGFTDCLLQYGATRVYAIDVGKGLLHWKLRNDPRVVVMEETNARYVEKIGEVVSLVTIDASFISLKILLPVIKRWLQPSLPIPLTLEDKRSVIALIKPQFEAGRKETARNRGVIRDAQVHLSVLMNVLSFAQTHGFMTCDLMRSPVLGPKGNIEFLAWLELGGRGEVDLNMLVMKVLGK